MNKIKITKFNLEITQSEALTLRFVLETFLNQNKEQESTVVCTTALELKNRLIDTYNKDITKKTMLTINKF